MRKSCDFFDGQTIDKKLEMPTDISCCKNVFLTIRYIVKYIFYISIFNNFLELIAFWTDQLVFLSGRGKTGDCTARRGLLGYAKVTCNRFTSLHRGQGEHLSGSFSCANTWSCHGQVSKGKLDNANAAGDN